MAAPEQATPTRRRPKGRKDKIVEAAHDLIGQSGFRNVSMAQIADEVGITAGALYWHFSNKTTLLGAVVDRSISSLLAPIAEGTDLDDTLLELCTVVTTRRDHGRLWWQELRHLEPAAREELRERMRGIAEALEGLIQRERPNLADDRALTLAYGVLVLLTTPSFHTTKMSPDEYAPLLARCCRSVVEIDLGEPTPVAESGRPGLEPISKREAMLSYAVQLFDERGFDATSLNDIGAAAGVTGPNLYSYFDSKAEILDAAVERGVSAMWLMMHSVLRANDNAADALRDLVRGHISLTLDRTIMTSVLLSEPAAPTNPPRARQREYIAEWAGLLRSCRPELDDRTARVLAHTVLTVIHVASRTPAFRRRGSLEADLTQLAFAVIRP